MCIYIEGPLTNKFTTECLMEKPNGPKADVNEKEITTDTSHTPRGCVGVKAVKIH